MKNKNSDVFFIKNAVEKIIYYSCLGTLMLLSFAVNSEPLDGYDNKSPSPFLVGANSAIKEGSFQLILGDHPWREKYVLQESLYSPDDPYFQEWKQSTNCISIPNDKAFVCQSPLLQSRDIKERHFRIKVSPARYLKVPHAPGALRNYEIIKGKRNQAYLAWEAPLYDGGLPVQYEFQGIVGCTPQATACIWDNPTQQFPSINAVQSHTFYRGPIASKPQVFTLSDDLYGQSELITDLNIKSGKYVIEWKLPYELRNSQHIVGIVQYQRRGGEWNSVPSCSPNSFKCEHKNLRIDDVRYRILLKPKGLHSLEWLRVETKATNFHIMNLSIQSSSKPFSVNMPQGFGVVNNYCSMNLNWTPPLNQSGVTGYEIQFNKRVNNQFPPNNWKNMPQGTDCSNLTTSKRFCTHKDLKPGDYYKYRIRTLAGNDTSPWLTNRYGRRVMGKGAGCLGTITWPSNAYSLSTLLVPYVKTLDNPPIISSPVDAKQYYKSTTPAICEVHATTGTITAIKEGTCVPRVVFYKYNYPSKGTNYSGVTVAKGVQDTTWKGYDGTIEAGNSKTSDDINNILLGANKVFVVTSGSDKCSVNRLSGEATGISPGICSITLTISKKGYHDLVITRSITVTNAATQTMGTIVWPVDAYAYFPGDLSGDLEVPYTRKLNNPPTITSPLQATRRYYSASPSFCTVDPVDGSVTAIGRGTCVVKVTFSQADYISKSALHSGIRIIGTGAKPATWNDYSGAVMVGWSKRPGLINDMPIGATKSFKLISGQGRCTVKHTSGWVRGFAPGSCTVELTISKAGKDDLILTNDITVIPGGKAMGTVTWPSDAYAPGVLVVPNTRALDNPPTITFPGGTIKRYYSRTPKICNIHSSTGAIYAKDAGECIVGVVFSKEHYEPETIDCPTKIMIVKGTQSATWDRSQR